ncbi:glycoside hydrolase family 20 protein [Postia placenta MAD-698-R-SB12]|uniref:beta-N-acetylhexosaminidase n=1 Tax=Postia placenta MAD-698-R-SB12 TaxID=670580 RepID=A0A1X6NE05_9APHY|nr:glycoside hydrolase family 20 protein [Postia placenta MAD-698-R-SB12]OSX66804.1 glycoside hydrolase family 20 protein [Postia placenta MAD-698-R-SB12]
MVSLLAAAVCFWINTLLLCSHALAASLQPQIPSIASFTSAGDSFQLSPNVRIIVDSAHGLEGAPSALSYAQTFRSDLMSVAGFAHVPPVEVLPGGTGFAGAPVIYIAIDPTMQFALYNGEPTLEGYDFEITEYTYTIKVAAAIGAWWGAVTMLQQVALTAVAGGTNISLPTGAGSDSPGWEVRGFMLDAGRHWFDTAFLSELCIYASFFKLNEFHLHASDNLWNPDFLYGTGNEGWKDLYAAFRFQPPPGSPIDGLVPRLNESWPENEFLMFQQTCSEHGVTVIPEIDTPGHSLAITQWKPELMLSGQPDLLNLSYPATIPAIKSIWQQFLPWFTSSEVSIGADEYDASLGDAYVSFVNEMFGFMQAEAGKSIRIWGTNEPSTEIISKNITIQHWDFPDADIPVQLLAAGYNVINSEQAFLYLDGKYSDGGVYPYTLSLDLMFSGAPDGGGWAPNIFSPNDPSNNTSPNELHLRGGIMALWSDWGNNATTMLEDYYQLAQSLAVVGEKTWAGSGMRASELSRAEFEAAYPILNAAAPGQNLNRVVLPEYGDVVYKYPFTYNTLTTPYASVGPPYTLQFSVMPDTHSSNADFLFSGEDSKLYVANLTFEATGQLYPLGYVLPVGTYTDVEIHATADYTYAIINGDEGNPRYWYTVMDIWGEYMEVANMSFAAPAQQIGGEGFVGSVKDVVLTLGV